MNEAKKRFLSKGRQLVGRAAVFSAIYFINLSIHAQTPLRPFSADQIKTLQGKTTARKIYATEKAMRVEAGEDGKKTVSIMRFDHKVMWTLTPDDMTYVVLHTRPGPQGKWIITIDNQMDYMLLFHLSPGLTEFARELEGAKVERESLGSEEVGPYHCEKSRVRVDYKGHVYTSIEWAAKELDGFVVKGQDEKGEWSTEYQNFQAGPQDPSLFEIPKGYKKSVEPSVMFQSGSCTTKNPETC